MTTKKLQKLIACPNIVDDLDEDRVKEIGAQVIEEFDSDVLSRMEWTKLADKILKLAKLVVEPKKGNTKGSNVKYPLTTIAIVQYAAKTYPEIVKDGKIVHAFVMGKDPDGKRAERAKRISDHMSYQCLVESDTWEVNMDKVLHVCPTIGVCWKKTFYDPIKKCNESILCLHDEIVINDNVESLEKAERVSHILNLSLRTIVSNMRAGIFTDYDIDEVKALFNDKEDTTQFIEQHRYLDLDDDDYAEPYIATVHKKSGKVFRIVARFDPEGITYTKVTKAGKEPEVIDIRPVQYFTDFHCLPRLDGKYHSYGLGTLAFHPNSVVNTLLNQLIDAGSLANMQGGFVGAGSGLKGGIKNLERGEWKELKALNGATLKDQIYPINYKEPSHVLYETLELMINAGEKLLTTTDAATGNQDVSNVKTGAAQLMDSNSGKVFTAMRTRLDRSLTSEFEKHFRLNRLYLPDKDYEELLNDPNAIARADYDDDNIRPRPVGNPNLAGEAARQQKVQFLSGFLGKDGINNQEILHRMFEAAEEPNIEKLFVPPAPKTPPPEILKIQMDGQKHVAQQHLQKMQIDIQQQQFQLSVEKVKAEIELLRAQAVAQLATADATTKGIPLEALELQLKHLDSSVALAESVSNQNLKQQEIDNAQQQAQQQAASAGLASTPSN